MGRHKKRSKGVRKSYNTKKRTVARTRGPFGSGSEIKYLDTSVDTATGDNLTTQLTWSSASLANPAGGALNSPKQGSAINERIGRNIYAKKIKINGFINIPGIELLFADESLQDGMKIRVILVCDKQTNGVAFDPKILINSGTGTVGTSPAIDMYQSVNAFGRFQVLYDKKFIFKTSGIGGDPAGVAWNYPGGRINFKITKNLKNLKVNFNNSSSAQLADIVDNSLQLLWSWDAIAWHSAIGGPVAPEIHYQSRFSFSEQVF